MWFLLGKSVVGVCVCASGAGWDGVGVESGYAGWVGNQIDQVVKFGRAIIL